MAKNQWPITIGIVVIALSVVGTVATQRPVVPSPKIVAEADAMAVPVRLPAYPIAVQPDPAVYVLDSVIGVSHSLDLDKIDHLTDAAIELGYSCARHGVTIGSCRNGAGYVGSVH